MEYVPRSKDRVDLLSFHTELGGMEMTPCQAPVGIEFEAILTDPALRDVQCFYLEGLRDAGVFFQGTVYGRIFCLHQEVVRKLYRVDNFFLKRNYFLSEKPRGKSPASETLEEERIDYQPTQQDHSGAFGKLYQQSVVSDHSGDMKKSPVNWCDLEDDTDVLDIFTNVSSHTVEARKQTSDANFLNEKFVDQLPTMGQRRAHLATFFSANPAFKRRDYYLFDYVALFVDFTDIFEDRSDFKISFISERLKLLRKFEGTDWELIPMQASNNKGWSSSIKFHCQNLSGEYQLSFLRVALFFSVRKVATSDKIRKSGIDEESKSFLLGDKSSQKDFLRVVRLNINALASNQKLLIDQAYAEEFISQVKHTT